jgi:AcrR family transcriptional regulator
MRLHGLPLASLASQGEREQLMATFAAVVSERGYPSTCLEDVAVRAGVPVETVTAYWASEVDCLLDAAATSTRQLFYRTAEVFMDGADDPARALHQALGAMLRDLAASPELTYMSTVELPRLGPLVRDRHHHMLDLFADFLQPGFAARGVALPNREVVSLCITGGLWRIVRQHAIERRLQELPGSLPAISYVVLSTFFGTAEALRVITLLPQPASGSRH